MRSGIDFSSWQALLSTLVGLAVITLVAVGIRLLVMQTMQKRRERENRQINERLRTLIAAYKTLGGSFTGDLLVDPAHLRDLRPAQPPPATADASGSGAVESPTPTASDARGGERRRRMRDAVEAALSDVLLLGTEEQVRLAAQAANDLVAGRKVETAALVISLRTFIRKVLDLDPVPPELSLPKQGPTRPGAAGSNRSARGEQSRTRSGGDAAGFGVGAIGASGIAAGLHLGQGQDR